MLYERNILQQQLNNNTITQQQLHTHTYVNIKVQYMILSFHILLLFNTFN